LTLLSLSSCAATIEVAAGSRATDLTEVKIGADKATVERVLGDPIFQQTKDNYHLSVYEYSLGVEGHPEMLLLWPLLVAYGGGTMAYMEWCTFDSDCDTKVEQEKAAAMRQAPILYDEEGKVISIATTIVSKSASDVGVTMIKAAEGDAEAQFLLASIVAADQGWRWLCLSAVKGHSPAQSAVAALLADLRSQMTPEEITLAERLVTRGEASPAECEGTINSLLENPRALANARMKATQKEQEQQLEEGNPEVQYEHGILLNNFELSWKWFCLAANQGYRKAQYAVGNFYRSGLGPVTQDPIKAYVWYNLAGDAGNARSKDKLASKMTSNQIAEADRLLAEWQPNPAECEAIGARAEN
jgi:TPR repeat protein